MRDAASQLDLRKRFRRARIARLEGDQNRNANSRNRERERERERERDRQSEQGGRGG